MDFYYLSTLLILLATTFSYLNHKFLKWPAPIAVMSFSLAGSLLLLVLKIFFPHATAPFEHVIASINFYHVLMKVFLGFILFAGAFRVSLRELRKDIKPVIMLAIISVVISTVIIGYVLFWFFHLINIEIPLLHCLLFGSLISPTDPVAVLGILKRSRMPASFRIKVVGESLFNDGIAIVLFTSLIETASTGQELNAGNFMLLFLREAGGGVALGLVLSGIAFIAIRSLDNFKVEILITLALVMVCYSVAEIIRVSAPIAVVITGLVSGNLIKTHGMSDKTKKYVSSFWDLVDDFLNLILFLLIGFELLVIPMQWLTYVLGIAVVVMVLAARFFAVLLPVKIFPKKFPKRSAFILTWCGLRGGISIALALSIPADLNRFYFVIFTYIVAVFSIIVQGLTIKSVIARYFPE